MITKATRMQHNPAPRIPSSGPCRIRALCPAPCAPREKTITKGVEITKAARNFVNRFDTDAPAEAKHDMFYSLDGPTPFCRWSEAHGARRVVDGLGMLVAQAAEAFAIWRGVTPDTSTVLRALRDRAPG